MMRSIIPIFMGLLNLVASRTEPIDFSDVSIASTRNYRNGVLFRSDNINNDLDDFTRLNNKDLTTLRQQFNNNNDDDTHNADTDDNLKQMEFPFQLDLSNSRKIAKFNDNDDDSFHDLDDMSRSINEIDESDMNRLTNFLTKLLREPSWQAPLVIIEEPANSRESEETENDSSDEVESQPIVWKRSRYYRRYPWKRHNSRSRNGYDYDETHFCTPSREDVFQLLVALHDVRQGNKTRTLNICNRRRAAGPLFTNIRFLGRRK